MKKLFTFMLLLALALPTMAKTEYFPGTIYFRDGREVDYPAIAIPAGDAKSIIACTDEKHKNKEKYYPQDVFAISLWHKNHPDKVHFLYPLNIASSKSSSTRICHLEHKNDWGAVFQYGDFYQIDKQGNMIGVVVSRNNMPVMVRHYLLRNGEEEAVLLYTNNSWSPKKSSAAKIFSDNPKIEEEITSGKLKPRDIEYILDAMLAYGDGSQSNDDDEKAGVDSPSPKKAAPKQGAAKQVASKKPKVGIDDDYEMYNGIRVEYTTHFSRNMDVALAYERTFRYFVAGVSIELPFRGGVVTPGKEDEIEAKPAVGLGIRAGAQIPVQLGNNHYIIPRVLYHVTACPLSMIDAFESDIYKPSVTMPLRVGADYAYVFGDYALNAGLYYGYEFDFYMDFSSSGDLYKQKEIRRSDLLSIFGNHGLTVSLAFCW